jgi:hypothetical protein
VGGKEGRERETETETNSLDVVAQSIIPVLGRLRHHDVEPGLHSETLSQKNK